jgi:hypothetical protein
MHPVIQQLWHTVMIITHHFYCYSLLGQALRNTGCLVGVITTDSTKTDADLVAAAKSWTIVGKDLLSVVCWNSRDRGNSKAVTLPARAHHGREGFRVDVAE